MTSSEIRAYADGALIARVANALSPTMTKLIGRSSDVTFKLCRPNVAGRHVWGPVADAKAIHVQYRWETDDNFVAYEKPLSDGTRCIICDPWTRGLAKGVTASTAARCET
jgi:hypothetical protein